MRTYKWYKLFKLGTKSGYTSTIIVTSTMTPSEVSKTGIAIESLVIKLSEVFWINESICKLVIIIKAFPKSSACLRRKSGWLIHVVKEEKTSQYNLPQP